MSQVKKHFIKIKTFEILTLVVILCVTVSIIGILYKSYFLNLYKNKVEIDEFKFSKLKILENSEIKINNLKISGNIKNNRYDKYALDAEHAIKNNNGIINLSDVDITFFQSSEPIAHPVKVQSKMGIYDENLNIFNSSSVTNIYYLKYIVTTNNLIVNLNNNSIKSSEDVNIYDDSMDIKAKSFNIDIDKQILNFNGNIQFKININNLSS